MTTEQIEKLAREYAEKKVPNRKTYGDDALYGEHYSIAKQVLEKLAPNYLIAEKEWTINIYKQCERYYEHNIKAGLAAYDTCTALEVLFGKPTFNPTEN